jgi:hypothetical protein
VLVIWEYIADHWRPIAYLLGMTFEIVGALLIANRYLNAESWLVNICGVISAFKRRRTSAAEIAALSGEKETSALRGLGLLCLGFILRSLPSIAELFDKHPNH